MIRLTQTGKIFLGVCILLYFASLTSQSGLLLLPIGILCGCYLVNGLVAWIGIRSLTVEAPSSIHLSEGQAMSQSWRVTNPGRYQSAGVQIECSGRILLGVGLLPPGETILVVPKLDFNRRGVYAYSGVEIVSAHPFGLMKASRRLELRGEVVVYPALYQAPLARVAGCNTMVGGKLKGRRKVSTGINFAGLRAFEAGDPLRQIHWKSSSRGQGLMVKTFEEELSGQFTFITDSV